MQLSERSALKVGLILLILISLLGTLALGLRDARSEEQLTQVIYRDGIEATYERSAGQVQIRWRFLRPGTPKLNSIVAKINGTPLRQPTITSYPSGGETTSILLLLDISDPSRETEILRGKKNAALLLRKIMAPHRGVKIFVYAGEQPQSLVAEDGRLETIFNILASVPPRNEPAKLFTALDKSLAVLGAIDSTRKAIFVLSDGHAADAGGRGTAASGAPIEEDADNSNSVPRDGVDKIISDARGANVGIYFLLSDSNRPKDIEAVARIAFSTAGLAMPEISIDEFSKRSIALLESGAAATYEFAPSERLFWQSYPKLEVVLDYADGQIRFEDTIKVQAAGLVRSLTLIWKDYKAEAIVGLLALLLGFTLIVYSIARRSNVAGFSAGATPQTKDVASRQKLSIKKQKKPTERVNKRPGESADAALIDKSGVTIPVKIDQELSIGRATSNDLVIDDQMVSRIHAAIVPTDNGQYYIENRSIDNRVLLNDKPIKRVALSDEDIIAIGSERFRFKFPS